jgi:hypothetical protein
MNRRDPLRAWHPQKLQNKQSLLRDRRNEDVSIYMRRQYFIVFEHNVL